MYSFISGKIAEKNPAYVVIDNHGIGYLINYGSQVFNLNLVITGIFILCIVSAVMYYLVAYLEKKLIKND